MKTTGKGRGNGPGKARELDRDVKLWISEETHRWLVGVAEEREWSVPQVIRRCIREIRERKCL